MLMGGACHPFMCLCVPGPRGLGDQQLGSGASPPLAHLAKAGQARLCRQCSLRGMEELGGS